MKNRTVNKRFPGIWGQYPRSAEIRGGGARALPVNQPMVVIMVTV